jgi:hypothetical protein
MGETAEIFGFSFVFRDALSSVYEISMDECPLDRTCKVDNIVYKAMVTTTDDGNTKEYIGMTATHSKKETPTTKRRPTSTTTRLIQSFPSMFGVRSKVEEITASSGPS